MSIFHILDSTCVLNDRSHTNQWWCHWNRNLAMSKSSWRAPILLLCKLLLSFKADVREGLCQKYNKEKEEKYEHSKYLDHEPTVGGNVLEIFDNFIMSCFNIQFCILNICINPEKNQNDVNTWWNMKQNLPTLVYLPTFLCS